MANPVPIPKIYGGNDERELVVGSQDPGEEII
jgi:hypothetical protein